MALPDTADAWVVRMHRHALSSAELRGLSTWLKGNPQRSCDLLQAQTVWLMLGGLSDRAEVRDLLATLRDAPTLSPLPVQTKPDPG